MASLGKVIVVGAGPVGSLAALYAAQRGYLVEVYELRPDLRNPGTIPLNFTRSINLALSERGINAMRHAEHPALLEHVMTRTISMRGRMIHGKDNSGALYEQAQDYDIKGRSILAIDRGALNKDLLETLDSLPNVKLFFNHKLTGADFQSRRAWFEVRDRKNVANDRPVEIEVDFDLMIGADGAHSAVRYHLMKFTRMDYQQEYIDTLWCEFRIEPVVTGITDARFRISPNHLHIWPGKEFMFIAIPSEDGSFTCTLFLPSSEYHALDRQPPAAIPAFFEAHFPGVLQLISSSDLIHSFQTNPHLPLVSIKCRPYHYSASGVIIGDAAHAMVPFYGQGMNAGLEDVRVLFDTLDKHDVRGAFQRSKGELSAEAWDEQVSSALEEYSLERAPDAHAINELALQNYIEMRSSVLSLRYRLRKFLEELISEKFPILGWQTKYARVSFTNEGYKDIIIKSQRQGQILNQILISISILPLILGGGFYYYKKYT